MSKKARGWTRQQRKRIKRKEHAGRMRARMRRQDAQRETERERKFARFCDMMAAAMRADPDRVGDDVWRVNPRRDALSR